MTPAFNDFANAISIHVKEHRALEDRCRALLEAAERVAACYQTKPDKTVSQMAPGKECHAAFTELHNALYLFQDPGVDE